MSNTNVSPRVQHKYNALTSEAKEGLKGLRALSKKLVKQALSWKLLRELSGENLGTNQVEQECIQRAWEREAKRGYRGSRKEFEKSERFHRDTGL